MISLHITTGGDHLRGIEIKATQKRRQPAKHDPLGLGQQRMRPIDRGPQGLLAAHRGTGTPGQQPEPVAQTIKNLGRRQRPHPRRRQLDRQRHPIQAGADLGHRPGILISDGKAGPGQAGAVGEQLDGFVGHRQRRHPPGHFTTHTDRLTARRQHTQPRRPTQESDDQLGACIKQVFAVIQHHQHLTVANKTQQRIHCRAAGLIRQTQRTGHRDRHHGRIGDRRKIHVPSTVTELRRDARRDLNGETALAGATGAGQGH